MKKQIIVTLIVFVFSAIGGLSAQNTDTMYVVKRHVVHDTVYVRDTLRVQDTVIIADYIHSEEFKQLFYELNGADAQTPPDSLQKMWAQTVTFLENRVIQYEQQNISTMDSIKKYGLAGLLLLGLHPADKMQLERAAVWCRGLGLEFKPYTGALNDLSDGDVISFGHSSLEVIATPGHTQGGVCFLSRTDNVLFSGDTLFAGSIGRTDNPGGDYDRLIESIVTKLLPLDGDTTVLPGHGPATSIGYERVTNPFVQPA